MHMIMYPLIIINYNGRQLYDDAITKQNILLVHKRIYWIRTIVRMAQHSNIIFTLRIINLRMRNPIYRHFVFFV